MPTLKPTMTRRTALLGLTAPMLLNGCSSLPPLRLPEGTQPVAFDLPGRALPLRCVVSVPSGYAAAASRWPLIIFLHGSGERGDDLEAVKMHGPPKLVAAGAAWPA